MGVLRAILCMLESFVLRNSLLSFYPLYFPFYSPFLVGSCALGSENGSDNWEKGFEPDHRIIWCI